MVAIIKTKEEHEAAINAGGLVVIDYYAQWCGPCKMMAPHFEAAVAKYPTVHFYKIDVDDAEEVSSTTTTMSCCTFVGDGGCSHDDYGDGKRLEPRWLMFGCDDAMNRHHSMKQQQQQQ